MPKQVKVEDVLDKLTELQALYKQINQQMLNTRSLNESAVNVISIIGEEQKTLKEITEACGLDKSTVSRQVNALVKKEWVQKTSGEDKRYAYFTLSEDAMTMHTEYKQVFNDYLEGTLSGWTEEEKQMLIVLLGRLNRSLSNHL